MKHKISPVLVLVIVLATLTVWAADAQGAESRRPGSLTDRPSAPEILSLPGPGVAAVQDAQNVELVDQLGGATWSVAVQGNYAYIGMGPRLVILNVFFPDSPTVAGKTQTLPDVINSLVVSGGHAYLAAGESGLRIINVSNPAAPVEVGYYDTAGYAEGVAVSGNYAYVADLDQGLRVINISNKTSPVEVGSYNPSGLGSWAYTVKVEGMYAYVAGTDGLRRINVSNPANPTLAGFFEILGGPSYKGVALSGNYAYVADGTLLRVIDLTNPTILTQAGSYDPPGSDESPYTVFVSGNYAYLGSGDSGLRLVNVSNPASPTGAGMYNTTGYAWESAVAGNYVYVADGYNGLVIVNVSNPMNPVLTASYAVLGNAHEVAAAEKYAYTTQWNSRSGLHIIDATNPWSMAQAAVVDLPIYAEGVAVRGNSAFVLQYNGLYSQLRKIDVSDPYAPTSGGSRDISGWAAGVAAVGNYVYVADGNYLRIYDGANLVERGVYTDTQGYPGSTAVVNNYAYVANTTGLLVIDVSNPTQPTFKSFYDSPGYAYAVAASADGKYAYLADGGQLLIINVSNKLSPYLAGSYAVGPGTATHVAVAGEYVYVSTGIGLLVLDVSHPATPTRVGYYDTPGWSEGVAVVGSRVYVACRDGGLLALAFRYAPTWATIPVGGGSLTSVADRTTYTFPAGTFTDTVLMTHTARLPGNAPSPNALAGINHYFDVTAVYSGTGQPAQPAPGHAYTITVQYTDAEKGPAIESTLGLYRWNGSTWSQDGIASAVDTVSNFVTARIDHFSLFAVLGETKRVYLPLVLRNYQP